MAAALDRTPRRRLAVGLESRPIYDHINTNFSTKVSVFLVDRSVNGIGKSVSRTTVRSQIRFFVA